MKTQNRLYNFFFFLLILFALPAPAQQVSSPSLMKADSLYGVQEFVAAFRIYDQLLQEQKKASPAMLLKMAYIQEGLGNYEQTLYYLYKYYYLTYDQQVLNKVNQIAENHNLEGYTTNDVATFKNLFFKYRYYIVLTLLFLALINIWYMIYFKRQYNTRGYGNGITNGVLLLLVIGILQVSPQKYALFEESPAYVMNGPSAGAEVISVSKKGNKAPILKQKDIWYEVDWHGDKAYIRNNQVLILHPNKF